MFHRITIIGFAGQEPAIRCTEDGTPVTHSSVAPRQVISKERVSACPQGRKESLSGTHSGTDVNGCPSESESLQAP